MYDSLVIKFLSHTKNADPVAEEWRAAPMTLWFLRFAAQYFFHVSRLRVVHSSGRPFALAARNRGSTGDPV
jgi:hypothetical protein